MSKKALLPHDFDPRQQAGKSIANPMSSVKNSSNRKKGLLNGPYFSAQKSFYASSKVASSSTSSFFKTNNLYTPAIPKIPRAFSERKEGYGEDKPLDFRKSKLETGLEKFKQLNEMPSNYSSFNRSQTPTQAPSQAPSQSQSPSQAPSQAPFQAPSQAPSQSQSQAQAPYQSPSLASSHLYHNRSQSPNHSVQYNKMSIVQPVRKKKKKLNLDGQNKKSTEDDDVQCIETPVSKEDDVYTRSNNAVKPQLHKIQVVASWILKLSSSAEVIPVSEVCLTTGLLEIFFEKDQPKYFTNDDIIQIRYDIGENKFKIAITVEGGFRYLFYGHGVLDVKWLYDLIQQTGYQKIGRLDGEASSKIEALYLTWAESAQDRRRSSSRIESMKTKDNSSIELLKSKRNSKIKPLENGQAPVTSFYQNNEFRAVTRNSSKTYETALPSKVDIPEYIPPPASNEEIFKFPDDGSKFAISVREHDFHRLNAGEFLNDTVIEFCFRYFQYEYPEKYSKTKIFNSYFYNHLTSNPNTGVFGGGSNNVGWNYEKVESWTKGFDIFSVDFIIVPINEHLHWYLAIIINPGAVLLNPEEDDVVEEISNSDVDELAFYSSATKEVEALPNNVDDEMDFDSNESQPILVHEDGELSSNVKGTKSVSRRPSPHKDKIGTGAINISSSSERDEIDCFADVPTGALEGGGQKSDATVSVTSEDISAQETFHQLDAEDPIIDSGDEDDFQVLKHKHKHKPTTTQDKKRNLNDSCHVSVQLDERTKKEKLKEDERRRAKEQTLTRKQTKIDKEFKCKRKKCSIVVLDSLNVPRVKPYQALKAYLMEEAKTKKADFLNGRTIDPGQIATIKNPTVPVQPNHYDCGVYVVKFVETLMKNPEKYTEYLLRKSSKRAEWFSYQDIVEFRIKTKSLMEELSRKYQEKHPKNVESIADSPRNSHSSSKSLLKKPKYADEDDDSDVIIID